MQQYDTCGTIYVSTDILRTQYLQTQYDSRDGYNIIYFS